MATAGEILEKLIPSVISGAGTALATVYGYLSEIKKRVTDLETRIGKLDPDTGNRSGLLGVIENLKKKVDSLEGASDELVKQVDSLEESVTARKSFSSADVAFYEDRLYNRASRDFAALNERLDKLEKKLDSLEGRIAQCQTVADAQKEREQRETALHGIAEKMGKIQGHIASLGDLLEKLLRLPK